MPLKFSLKPGEKFVLNAAVLANGDKRTSLVIQNKACLLREKDIMQPEGANTSARRIYLAIMMMYLVGTTASVSQLDAVVPTRSNRPMMVSSPPSATAFLP